MSNDDLCGSCHFNGLNVFLLILPGGALWGESGFARVAMTGEDGAGLCGMYSQSFLPPQNFTKTLKRPNLGEKGDAFQAQKEGLIRMPEILSSGRHSALQDFDLLSPA